MWLNVREHILRKEVLDKAPASFIPGNLLETTEEYQLHRACGNTDSFSRLLFHKYLAYQVLRHQLCAGQHLGNNLLDIVIFVRDFFPVNYIEQFAVHKLPIILCTNQVVIP